MYAKVSGGRVKWDKEGVASALVLPRYWIQSLVVRQDKVLQDIE
jgi:hypothetical protein